MDQGRILVVNLAKGQIGESNAHLLGALLVTGIANAALARADAAPKDRRPFFLYCDEFQSFATESFGLILSEARKYGLSLTLAHQYLGQLPESLRQAVMGNTGTVISFRLGAEDAPLLAKHLDLDRPGALQDLDNFNAYGRFLQQGRPSSATFFTLPQPANP